MARSAMEAGDWDLAEFIAAQMLDHDAAYGGSHFTLALVLRHKRDDAGVPESLRQRGATGTTRIPTSPN